MQTLSRAYTLAPDDPVIMLSFIEVLYDYYTRTNIADLLEQILHITEKIKLESFLEALILYYKLQVLIELKRKE